MADIPTALRIIRDNDIRSPREFAKKMWPNSEGWQRVHKVGRGSSRGAAMALAGGGFLGKLKAQGLIRGGYDRGRIILTDKGKERLPDLEIDRVELKIEVCPKCGGTMNMSSHRKKDGNRDTIYWCPKCDSPPQIPR